MAEKLRLRTAAGEILLYAPYNKDMPSRAREIGGRWDRANKVWVFPLERLEEVRALCLEIYNLEAPPLTTEELYRSKLVARLETLVAESNRISDEIKRIQRELAALG